MALRVTPVVPPSTTWANKPSNAPSNAPYFISDAGTKGSFWYYDGTRWKPMNGNAVLATLDTASSNIANSETVVTQYLIPANLWQTNDRIRIYNVVTKSGTTDASTYRIRLGTAGTTADTAIFAGTSFLSAAQRTYAGIYEFRLASATSVQALMPNSIYGYSNAIATAFPSPTTVSSASANALYLSICILSNGTTDTVQLVDSQFQLVSSAN